MRRIEARHRGRRGRARARTARARSSGSPTAVGAQSVDAVADRIAALQDELRETKRRLKAGGTARACPKPAELAAQAGEVAPGVRLVAAAVPLRVDGCAQGAPPRTSAACLGSGVIALGLDADEPQLFVTVSDDLVARGISAGDLVDGRDAGRSTAVAAAARRWPRAGARDATAWPTRSAPSLRTLAPRQPRTLMAD